MWAAHSRSPPLSFLHTYSCAVCDLSLWPPLPLISHSGLPTKAWFWRNSFYLFALDFFTCHGPYDCCCGLPSGAGLFLPAVCCLHVGGFGTVLEPSGKGPQDTLLQPSRYLLCLLPLHPPLSTDTCALGLWDRLLWLWGHPCLSRAATCGTEVA